VWFDTWIDYKKSQRIWCLALLRQHNLDELLVLDTAITADIGLAQQLINLLLGKLLADGSKNVTQLSSLDVTLMARKRSREARSERRVLKNGLCAVESRTSALLVENLESLADILFAVLADHLLGHQSQKLQKREHAKKCQQPTWAANEKKVSASSEAIKQATFLGKDLSCTVLISITEANLREIDGAVSVCVDLSDHLLELGLSWVLSQRSHNDAQFFVGDASCNTKGDNSVIWLNLIAKQSRGRRDGFRATAAPPWAKRTGSQKRTIAVLIE
jgi:hypothetical protein